MKSIASLSRPKTGVIYTRVSSKEQVGGYSLADQERICRRYAENEGIKILKVFREEGESAKIIDRTQMNLMRQYCAQHHGEIGYVIVYKTDRFSRDASDHFLLRKSFRDHSIELRSATELIEETPHGKFFELMLAGIANLDNDVRTERTINGMRSKAEDGHWPSGAPWGYQNVTNALGKRVIEPHPERAPVVKFLFEEFARGTNTFHGLAKKVNTLWDVKSKHGKKIGKQLVQKILCNPVHYGWVEFPKFGISVQGKHEPIISVELFNEVQEIMRKARGHKQPRNRNNPEFLLKGCECGYCGRNLTGGFVKGRSNKYPYYSCMNPDCPGKSIRREDLENDFTEFLERYTPDSLLMEALEEALRVVSQKQSVEGFAQTNKVQKKREGLESELDELLQLRISGVIDDKTYLNEGAKRKEKIRELKVEEESFVRMNPSPDSSAQFGLRLIAELPLTWKMLEAGELKALRRVLFPKNLQYTYPGFKTAELSPIYKVKAASGTDKNRLVTSSGFEPEFTP